MRHMTSEQKRIRRRSIEKTVRSATRRRGLRLEQLERRNLLATVAVFAEGTTGTEAFDLLIDNSSVASYALTDTSPAVLIFESDEPVTADQIKVQFTNDLYDAAAGIDRNLIVDKIAIDGKPFETEDASTFSTGTWTPDFAAAVPGNRYSEWLHTDGYFQYANQRATTIAVTANGSTGDEVMRLSVNGLAVTSWNVTTTSDVYSLELDEVIDPAVDSIQVEFVNDLYDPANGIDRDLVVDVLEVNGVAYQTEDATTYSTGTLFSASGVVPGYAQSEALYTNGYFQYLAPSSTVVVNASGDIGTEQMTLNVAGQDVATFDVETAFQSFVYDHSGPLSASDIRIIYADDIYDPDNGIDTNLNVDWIEVDSVRFETDAASVFSTGTWSPVDETIQPGLGRGESLHVDGYLQYAMRSTLSVRAQGATGSESFDVSIDGKKLGNFTVTEEFTTIDVVTNGIVTADQVRLEYNSDELLPGETADRMLTIDWIEINTERFETEADSTYSAGTGIVGGRIQHGFGNGESLEVNGFFQFHGVVTNSDAFSIPEDSLSVPLAVLANDITSASNTVTIAQASSPANGTLDFIDGVLYYTPIADFVGTDSFTYQIASNNGSRQMVPASVEITINQSHQQPQSSINPAVASELTPSGQFLVVEKLVQLPRDEGGRQPRMNSMATQGDRIFVVTDGSLNREGEIYELVTDAAGETTAELFLDAGAAIYAQTGLEIDNSSPLFGLRSLAFHPEYASNGKFYTTYIGERPADPSQYTYLSDPPNPVVAESVLAEWTVDLQTGQVDEASYREVFRVGMIALDHPIRGVVFNPYAAPGDEDYGLLYVGHGDASEQSAVAGDGQNNDALGKILRIDPLQSGASSYTVPASNPFVGNASLPDEVYALGFRNPHNLTFAPDASGEVRLIATEIGRDNVEEINLVVKGGNYGWADREGVFVHLKDQFEINGNITNLPADDALNDVIYPVSILGHEGIPGQSFVGQAITGSHVIQNGSTDLDDQFIFVEFATDGRAYHIDYSDMQQQVTKLDINNPDRDSPADLTWLTPNELTILFDHDNDDSTTPLVRDSLKDVLDDEPDFTAIPSAGKIRADLRLGQGPAGELYIMNKRNGWVYLATNTVAPPNVAAASSSSPFGASGLPIAEAEPQTENLASNSWQNNQQSRDVNQDGSVTPVDALVILNRLNDNPETLLPAQRDQGQPMFDVNGDRSVTPVDALQVLNSLAQATSVDLQVAAAERHSIFADSSEELLPLEREELLPVVAVKALRADGAGNSGSAVEATLIDSASDAIEDDRTSESLTDLAIRQLV